MASLTTNHYVLLAFVGFWGLVALAVLLTIAVLAFQQRRAAHHRVQHRRIGNRRRRTLAATDGIDARPEHGAG
jgi:hypothetical protein